MPPRLGHYTVPRIDEQNGELCRACGGHHVAGVLLVPGRVGNDEFAKRSCKIAIRDVNGDALLALGNETVGQERFCDVRSIAASWSARIVLVS
jgi:hypothetical protein